MRLVASLLPLAPAPSDDGAPPPNVLVIIADDLGVDRVGAYAEVEDRLDPGDRRDACYLLWKATGERSYLEAAKLLLDEMIGHADAGARASMLKNLRVNREIMSAWNVASGVDASERGDSDASATETPTRGG